ncbi:MAG: glycosyltransferase [Bacteroidota bacterium]|nr:glycosyltransferase [Bacteroidota bacterium]
MIAFSFFTLFAALTGVYVLFLFRLRAGIRHLAALSPDRGTDITTLPPVTVLLPVRNEEAFLPQCLHSLASQDYPAAQMEVLVIDDHSTDRSAEIARTHAQRDARFRLLSCSDTEEGKKAALTRGVSEAHGEVIVTTDADCRHDASWLRTMLRPFAEGADVVAGPVVIDTRETLFARLQALEFLGLMGVGAGFFGIGFPRLCNAANFAYRRRCFADAGGYEGNSGIHSGDDEFLLHDIVYRQGGRAVFATAPAALVRTGALPSVTAFLQQRVRWASKGSRYEDRRFVSFLVLLFVYFLFAAAAPAVSLTSSAALLAGIVFFLLKIIADGRVLFAAAALFRQPLRVSEFLAAEFLHAYYIVVVSIFGLFGVYSWKNRNVTNT